MRQRTETYYRRHQDCARGHSGFTYEPDERRAWKPCLCAIYFYGRLRPEDPKPIRKRTGVLNWREAEAVVAGWRAGLSTPPPSPEPEPPPPPVKPGDKGKTEIELLGATYIDAMRQDNCADSTIKKYKILVRKIAEFASGQRHYASLKEWTRGDSREFMAWWKGAVGTQGKKQSNLRAFFAFAKDEGWVTENPAIFERRRRRNRAARTADKISLDVAYPYTDQELQAMIHVCEFEYGKKEIKWHRTRHGERAAAVINSYTRKWDGEDLKDFIFISTYLGLRIGQCATFHIDYINEHNDVRFRAIKNDEYVDSWVPEWLEARIRERTERIGPLIFGEHQTDDPDVIADVWRRKLKIVWKLCEKHLPGGKWERKPTHHRFRHTFVRILLQAGVAPAVVAELIGDTERIVRKVYSAWVPERQAKLRAALQKAFGEMPRLEGTTGRVIPFRK